MFEREDSFCNDCGIVLSLGKIKTPSGWIHYCERCDFSFKVKEFYTKGLHCDHCNAETLHVEIITNGKAVMTCNDCKSESKEPVPMCGYCASASTPCDHCINENGGAIVVMNCLA